MPSKWNLDESTAGRTVEVTFFPNPSEDSAFKLRATQRIRRRRSPAVAGVAGRATSVGARCRRAMPTATITNP
jgi:hypothetical protein